LIAVEGFALGFAEGGALLLDGVGFVAIVHAGALGFWPSGSIAESWV
jgi:hypothetical protein